MMTISSFLSYLLKFVEVDNLTTPQWRIFEDLPIFFIDDFLFFSQLFKMIDALIIIFTNQLGVG